MKLLQIQKSTAVPVVVLSVHPSISLSNDIFCLLYVSWKVFLKLVSNVHQYLTNIKVTPRGQISKGNILCQTNIL